MFLDDLTPGFRFETGRRTVSEEEILAFAHEWDPQPFHIDPEAAKDTVFGGLIASGFHTLLIGFRLTLDMNLLNEASMGSPGFAELRWVKPVRPGDTLHTTGEVLSVTPSASRPDRGRTDVHYQIFNQDGLVAEYTGTHILKRRP